MVLGTSSRADGIVDIRATETQRDEYVIYFEAPIMWSVKL
jgi:hypothetical protein